MASSKVMASTSTANPDPPRNPTQSSSSSSSLQNYSPSPSSSLLTTTSSPSFTPLQHPIPQTTTSFGSVNMEDMLKNMYPEPDSTGAPSINGAPIGVVEPRMTLEDFLTKAEANSDEDVLLTPPLPAPAVIGGGYEVDQTMMSVHFPATAGPTVHMQNGSGVYGMVATAAPVTTIRGSRGGGGRGKRKGGPVEEIVIDKATQQKQKRMIKNRESAARSRERKQAYTVELESLVTQLENENARLLLQEDEKNRERFKQLMETLIPVVEKRRQPRRTLRRVQSMSW